MGRATTRADGLCTNRMEHSQILRSSSRYHDARRRRGADATHQPVVSGYSWM
jgi:hypothetical protein